MTVPESERETVATPHGHDQLGIIEAPQPQRNVEELEAIELTSIKRHTASAVVTQGATSLTGWARITHPLTKFWKSQISITVDHDACRDHLGMD